MCSVYRMLLQVVKVEWKKIKYRNERNFSLDYLLINLKNFDKTFVVVHFMNWSDILLLLLISHVVPLIASPITAVVSHRKPASAVTSRDSRHVRGLDKRNSLIFKGHPQLVNFDVTTIARCDVGLHFDVYHHFKFLCFHVEPSKTVEYLDEGCVSFRDQRYRNVQNSVLVSHFRSSQGSHLNTSEVNKMQ